MLLDMTSMGIIKDSIIIMMAHVMQIIYLLNILGKYWSSLICITIDILQSDKVNITFLSAMEDYPLERRPYVDQKGKTK